MESWEKAVRWVRILAGASWLGPATTVVAALSLAVRHSHGHWELFTETEWGRVDPHRRNS